MEGGNRRSTRSMGAESKDQASRRPPRKSAPPDQTNAENFYYIKQMQSKTQMVIVMRDGETLEGIIEWYDKTCLKFNRENGPNLLIYKPNIKYMYKAGS